MPRVPGHPALSRGFLIAALGVAFVFPAARAAQDDPAGAPWTEIRTAHLQVFTDGDGDAARVLAHRLELFREALRAVAPMLGIASPSAGPSVPTSIYLFASPRAFDPFRGGRQAEGWFVPRPDGNYVAVQSGSQYALEVVRHELVHQFLRENAPDIPLWLNEGLAEFWRNADLDDAHVVLGGIVQNHLATLDQRWPMRMAEVLTVTGASADYNEASRTGRFYATAWAAVHELMTGPQAERARLARYIALSGSGLEPAKAFALAFGREPARFDRDVLAHVRRLAEVPATLSVALPPLAVDTRVAVRRLPPDEACARLGLLVVHQPDPSLAEDFFRRALSMNAHSALALLGRGLSEWAHGAPQQALPLFRAAVEADPSVAMGQFFLGVALLDQYRRALPTMGSLVKQTPTVLLEARAHLRQAAALDPAHVEARAMLGLTYSFASDDADEGVPLLEQAYREQPKRWDLALALAQTYASAARFDAARAVLQQVIARAGEQRVVQSAWNHLGLLAFNEGMKLLDEGRGEDAWRMMQAAVAAAVTPELKSALSERLASLRQRETDEVRAGRTR